MLIRAVRAVSVLSVGSVGKISVRGSLWVMSIFLENLTEQSWLWLGVLSLKGKSSLAREKLGPSRLGRAGQCWNQGLENNKPFFAVKRPPHGKLCPL